MAEQHEVREHENRHGCPCIIAGFPQQCVVITDGERRAGWMVTWVHSAHVARARRDQGHP